MSTPLSDSTVKVKLSDLKKLRSRIMEESERSENLGVSAERQTPDPDHAGEGSDPFRKSP